MPVLVTYGFEFVQNLDLTQGPSIGMGDVTSLANGGFAASSTSSGLLTSNLDIFNSTATHTGGRSALGFHSSAIDQLSNGNLVVVGHDFGFFGHFVITDGAGNIVIPDFNMAVGNETLFDVAALAGGGFAVVNHKFISSTDNDIVVRVFDNIGANQAYFTVDLTTADDRNASVAALDNGTFAVAWTRTVGANTQIWYALYNATGGVIRAPAIFDGIGNTNRNVSVTATNGGFAFAYEDNGWGTGNTDISLASFDTGGNLLNLVNLNNPAFAPEPSNETDPALTRLANGMLAVSFGNNAFPLISKYDTFVELVDPVSLQVLASSNVTGGNPLGNDVGGSSVAGFGLGRLAVFHTDNTAFDAVGEDLQAVRNAFGDAAANTIVGDDFKDFMFGSGGSDTLSGLANNDQLFGGEGDDLIGGGDGDDQIFGELGNDLIVEGNGADSVAGGGGDDVIVLASDNANDAIAGDADVDTLELVNATGPVTVVFGATAFAGTVADGGLGTNSFTGIERISGSLFSDLMTGGAGGETLFGSDGDDALIGNDGDDFLFGEFGDDVLIGGLGNDTLNGGANTLGGLFTDTADYSQAVGGGVAVYLGFAGAQVIGADQGIDKLIGIENLVGSIADDVLLGNAEANGLAGREGNDFLRGDGGDDTLDGGTGSDLVVYFLASAGVTVSLAIAGAQAVGADQGSDTLIGVENLTGSSFNDTLTGDAAANIIDGVLGNDTMAGGGGNDTYSDNLGDTIAEALNAGSDTVNTIRNTYTLPADVERVNFVGSGNFVGTGTSINNRFQGGTGDDRFVDVLGGADIFSGNAGIDTVDFRSSSSGAIIDMATLVNGGAALGDRYSGIEKFLGSNTAADTMTGGGGGRWVFAGGGGNDTLTGGVKNDQLLGQGGNDTLSGGNGGDSLDGGTGNDTMTGGAAGDVFVFIDAAFGQDTIADYQDGLDSFKVFSAVADNINDFTVTNNNTASVTLTLIAAPANFITINGAAPINITAADFVFY